MVHHRTTTTTNKLSPHELPRTIRHTTLLIIVLLSLWTWQCWVSTNHLHHAHILQQHAVLLGHFSQTSAATTFSVTDDDTFYSSNNSNNNANQPNPPLSDGNTTAAACLLVMDDNHRLTEWMAYHWYVLPLRHVIVATDPRSVTHSSRIWDAWRQRGVFVQEWNDTDFWTARAPLPSNATFQHKRDRHRGRQKYFYRACLAAMQTTYHRTWVTLHDTDEYLVYNHAGGTKFAAWQLDRARRHAHSKKRDQVRMQPAQPPPTTADEGAMIPYINAERAAGTHYYQSPCIGVPRLQFSAQLFNHTATSSSTTTTTRTQQQEEEKNESIPPDLFTRLDTLRYRTHAARNDFVKNALGKVLLDVSRLPPIAKQPLFQSLHRPMKKICPPPWHNEWEVGLRMDHYLGSWEAYAARPNDARRGLERSREQWEYKSLQAADENDDVVTPWVAGFVQKYGTQPLAAAGHIPNRLQQRESTTTTSSSSWTLSDEHLSKIIGTDKSHTRDGRKSGFEGFVRDKFKQQQQH